MCVHIYICVCVGHMLISLYICTVKLTHGECRSFSDTGIPIDFHMFPLNCHRMFFFASCKTDRNVAEKQKHLLKQWQRTFIFFGFM